MLVMRALRIGRRLEYGRRRYAKKMVGSGVWLRARSCGARRIAVPWAFFWFLHSMIQRGVGVGRFWRCHLVLERGSGPLILSHSDRARAPVLNKTHDIAFFFSAFIPRCYFVYTRTSRPISQRT